MMAWVALVLIGLLAAGLLGSKLARGYWNWRIREFRYRQAKDEVKQSRRR